MLRNFSISTRIISLILLFMLSLASLLSVVVFTADRVKLSGVQDSSRVMLEGEKNKLMLGTRTIAHALSKALAGISDPVEQANIISQYINDIRFEADNSGYYFVYRGTVVFVHPVQPNIVGKDLKDAHDAAGVYFVSELYKAAQSGGGFVSFVFGKPQADGSIADAPKLAYAEMIPGTDLWISTGIYIDNIEKHRSGLEQKMASEVRQLLYITIGGVLALICFVLLPLSFYIVKSLTHPLRQTTQAATSIAQGNLHVKLSVEGKDEITVLQKSLLHMVTSLQASLAEVQAKESEALAQAQAAQKSSETTKAALARADAATAEMIAMAEKLEIAASQVESTAAEISHNTSGMRNGAGEQENRISEILFAMERLSRSVSEIAGSAGNAADKSEQARQMVEEGTTMAEQTGTAMQQLRSVADNLKENTNKLGEQSKDIGQIMDVINEIADQTNLLALNAAIEAARAGDAGRGFAVVADEVRKLAEKTVNATKEVRSSIVSIQDLTNVNIVGMDDAVKAITEVNELSTSTVASLQKVQITVEEAAKQVNLIATSVEEQSESSAEVEQLVNNVKDIIGKNANLTEQVDRTVQSLSHKSSELMDLVAKLRTS